MANVMQGKITYANGMAAAGVEVRVYDQDAPGKGDDDLTTAPGLSDAQGAFSVTYDPGRYLDFVRLPLFGGNRAANGVVGSAPTGGLRLPDPFDLLTPYLQFSYQVDGQPRTFHCAISAFQSQYSLPEALPVTFTPSKNGFHFPNLFKGYMMPFSLPFLPDASKVPGGYGLCGGMSAGAADFALAGRAIPALDKAPTTGQPLQRYVFRRAMDSFAMGESILHFARWMGLEAGGLNGLERLTMEEYMSLRAALASHRLAPLGLVLAQGSSLQDISRHVWDNHQVLAYGFSEAADGSSVDVSIYDPNYPNNDTMHIHGERVLAGADANGPIYGLRCTRCGGWDGDSPVRGFFPMPYTPIDPPEDLG